MSQPYPGQQQQYYAPAPPPKKRRVWLWVLLGVILAFVMMFAACAAMIGGAASSAGKALEDAGKTVHHVTYQVETSGPAAFVNYDTSTAGGISSASASGVKSGWSIDVDQASILGPDMSANISDSGTVTCRILSGGKVIKQASSSGQYASVTCHASNQELEGK